MAKLTASLTRKFSVELTDGQWESAEASFSVEDEKPMAKLDADAMRAFVKAQVDAEMGRQKDEILGIRPLEEVMDAINAAEAFGKEVGAEVTHTPEEKPPLPGDETRAAMAKEFTEVEVVRTPLAEGHKSFVVTHLEVAASDYGKYLKVYGWPNKKKPWVPAWNEAAQDLFDDINDMDAGQTLPPPYPIEAVVVMGEYKGHPSPQNIVEWQRVG